MTGAAPAARAVEAVLRAQRGRLLAALVGRLGDFPLAEDALQEAALSAITHWGRAGLPRSPEGWLLRVAQRKALDRLRGDKRAGSRAEALAHLARDEAEEEEPGALPDERLALILTCCHPALEEKTRVALTLRSVCGLSTAAVAAVFLDAEATMGQRLSRARAKIAGAGIRFALPGAEDLLPRMQSVLSVIYLIYTAGYSQGPVAGADLCGEAIFLARLVDGLCPETAAVRAEVAGCLALLLLTQARAGARVATDGATLPPAGQDRRLWDAGLIAEGRARLHAALSGRNPGPFQIKAAIADCQMAEGGPDWPQIASLYALLLRMEPTAVVALNHAVAVAEAGDAAQGLALTEGLAAELSGYQPFHAARAALLARAGRYGESWQAYGQAIALAPSAADAAFLVKAREKLPFAGQA